MKIAILNHCYLTPAHMDQLRSLGEVVVHESTTNRDDAIARIKGAQITIADEYEFPIDREFFESAAGLQYVCLNSTGFNLVALDAARAKGVLISNLPGFSTEAVAEHAIALMFSVMRNIRKGDIAMHAKPFQLNPANRAEDVYISTNVLYKTMGIIGLGRIGTRIAEIAHALGMKVIAYNRSPKDLPNVRMVPLNSIYSESDVIVIASAFEESMRDMIGEAEIKAMKKSVFIINIARGEFIDESALALALQQKRVGGFGADVITQWTPENPLLRSDSVVLTPHMAFLADESIKNMADAIVENVRSFIAGKPVNLVG